MAIDEASFVLAYPEFGPAPTGMVTAELARQLANTQAEMNDTQREMLVFLKTADTLARSAFAKDLKLMRDNNETVFTRPLHRLLTQVTMHRRFA